mmetsp:Transcript_78587/g.139452  ORF Transcript_78587/g.139452 Transcript_78587/m.139452 type:complete len:288 (+) Transcript_78587:156-1019(+)
MTTMCSSRPLAALAAFYAMALIGGAKSQGISGRDGEGLHSLWGTPIMALIDMEAAKANVPLAAYARSLAAVEPPEIRSNRNGGWQSRNKAFLDPMAHPAKSGVRKHVKRLRARILASLRQYLETQLRLGEGNASSPLDFEVSIDASWCNVNPPGAINGPHVHPFSAVSGAYYIDCGRNASMELPCAISLMDPRPSSAMASLPAPVRDALDFGIDWDLKLWPGTVLIFPSWLMHWVPPNTAPRQRITISFNAGVKLTGKTAAIAIESEKGSATRATAHVPPEDRPLDG